jgi:tetratricopeptide (TPR) repeat protein/predicted Ser/Thr protein kinase
MPCPTEQTFAALAFGRAEDVDTAAFFSHLEGCDDCRRRWYDMAQSGAQVLGVTQPFGGRSITQPFPPGTAPDAPPPLARGAILGRYVVLDRLGGGGMGVVYSAYDPHLDRKIAIKLLRPDISADPTKSEGRARLMREAKALARLAHPNVVTVLDVGMIGEQLFVAMELIDGRTLNAWVAEDKPSWRAILDAYFQAGQALAAAHGLGIVHRDFKPDNVLIDGSGRVRVVDFGLARTSLAAPEPTPPPDLPETPPLGEIVRLTQTGSVLGTPGYMAPEQFLGQPTDAAADQFSFCVSLYESLWDQKPFEGSNYSELMQSVVSGKIREPPSHAAAPLWIHRVLTGGLRRAPRDRYPSMNALLAELGRDPARARRTWLIGAAAVALAAVALAGVVRLRAPSKICRGSAQKLAGVWDGHRRRAVHDALTATKKSFAQAAFVATANALDAYANAWSVMYTDSCEATRVRGEQSEEVMELRAECLDGRREDMRALVDILAQADAQVTERAAQAVQNLPGLDECRNAEALRQLVRPPAGPEAHARVAALRTRLAETAARRRAGRYTEARQRAEALVTDARALGYAPVLAEALRLRGVLEQQNGNPRAAADTLLQAAAAAEIGRHDHARAEALTELVFVVGEKLGRDSEGHAYYQLAKAVLTRVGGDAPLEVRLDVYEAVVLGNEARYDEAIALLKRAVARLEQLPDQDANYFGAAFNDLGEIYRRKGDVDEAIASYKRALAIYQKTNGPDHPWVAFAWNNLGSAWMQKGDTRDAIDALERAVAIREAALGPDNAETAIALGNLGDALGTVGQFDRGREMLERAYAIKLRAFGPHHPSLSHTEMHLGRLYLGVHRLDEAMAHAERARAIRERVYGGEHPLVAEALILIGHIRLARGDASEAAKLLERAVAILEHQQAERDWLPSARFALAEALWDGGRDRERARALATAALPDAGRERADIEAWLAHHR